MLHSDFVVEPEIEPKIVQHPSSPGCGAASCQCYGERMSLFPFAGTLPPGGTGLSIELGKLTFGALSLPEETIHVRG